MRPVLVWSNNKEMLLQAHTEAVEWGLSVGNVFESEEGCSFQIHARMPMPEIYKEWMSKGVLWVQIAIIS